MSEWTWQQPTDRADLVNRLAYARDLAVPDRERENLCGCAYTELRQQERELIEARTDLVAAQNALARRIGEVGALHNQLLEAHATIARLEASVCKLCHCCLDAPDRHGEILGEWVRLCEGLETELARVKTENTRNIMRYTARGFEAGQRDIAPREKP